MLDSADIHFEDIRQNMEELDFINTHLGGHRITIAGVKKLLTTCSGRDKEEWLICEVGCGGGDNMVAIQRWCDNKKIKVSFVGIDKNPFCIEIASVKLRGAKASFVVSDYILTSFTAAKPDFIFSSLFCHHFTDEELISMLGWMHANAEEGFFINDLHRHRLAFYSILLLTRFFSKSFLVKNDAPLSVLRGFTRKEWTRIIEAAGIPGYDIRWKWAFRHLITFVKGNDRP